ncbi:peptidase M4 family protein, partial [Streptomyces sp. NPDC002817]
MAEARTFCTFVPPHILERLAQHEDPELAGPARRTLERDAFERTHRRLTTVVGAPSVAAPPGAEAGKPHRTVYDARHRTDLPGKKVRTEGSEPGKDATVNRAYAGLGATFELFLAAYQRDS